MTYFYEQIKGHLPQAQLELSSKFASTEVSHRDLIRTSICDLLKVSQQERFQVLDLAQRPALAKWSVSISHCPKLGGWIGSPTPTAIGLDIEEKSRIRDEVVKRICRSWELEKAPTLPYIWCAKEAFYKALGQEQPPALTQLSIDSWSKSGSTWIFSCSSSISASGAIWEHAGVLVAICVSNRESAPNPDKRIKL